MRIRVSPERPTTTAGRTIRTDGDRPMLSLDEELALGRRMADARQRGWEALLDSPGAQRELVAAMRSASDAEPDLKELLADDSEEARDGLAQLQTFAAAADPRALDRLPASIKAAARGLRIRDALYERLVAAHRRFARASRAHSTDAASRTLSAELERVDRELALAHQDSRTAQAILVRTHLRFVVAIARSYRNRGVDLGDLVQEGNLGLIRAAEKFDYRMGCRFNTYAMYWIRATIRACIANQSRTIRVPTRRLQTLARVRRAERKLENLHGRSPSETELASELGATVEDIRDALDVPRDAIHLSAPASEDDAESGLERLPDPSEDTPLRAALGKHDLETAHSLLALLSPREARVLKLRFGIDERSDHTLEEIGRMFGVTRERIRQIEARALSKLRTASEASDPERLAG